MARPIVAKLAHPGGWMVRNSSWILVRRLWCRRRHGLAPISDSVSILVQFSSPFAIYALPPRIAGEHCHGRLLAPHIGWPHLRAQRRTGALHRLYVRHFWHDAERRLQR